MPYKKRNYYKNEEAKARDYSLFVIACSHNVKVALSKLTPGGFCARNM